MQKYKYGPKKMAIMAGALALILTGGAFAAQCFLRSDPVVVVPAGTDAFTDVVAAPIGTPVSVYGLSVNGPIVVGSVQMTNCPIVNETVFDITETGVRLAKTTCWLEGVPTGTTTISAGASDELPFYVNTGTVTLVETVSAFQTAMSDVDAGDVFVLKGFEYDLTRDNKTNGGQHIIYSRDGEHPATDDMPISLIGYPGDPPVLVVDGVSNGNRGLSISSTGWTIANIDWVTFWQALGSSEDTRFVGNRIVGMTGDKYGAGTGTIVGAGNSKGGWILGNTITGGASNWRYDHAIYLNDCPVDRGWVVDWNYIYANNFARGPQIVVNHQVPRCGINSENVSVASHYIRNNTVDTTTYRGRCIGISAFGWQPENNSTPPAQTYIQNNDLINCGYSGTDLDTHGDSRTSSAIYASEGGGVISENRLIRSEGGIYVGSPKVASSPELFVDTAVLNNEIDDASATEIGVDVGPNPFGSLTISGNVFGPVSSLP